MKKCLAIITARGGSKRIPRKNIKNFLGSPIIKYSIDAALQAGCFDEVMVSTDDDEIAALALALGAKVPFTRSKENSNDYATTANVISEVLSNYKRDGESFEYACCIYPTAPFVTAEKLKIAYQKLKDSSAKTLVPVVSFGFPILRSFNIENGLVKMNWPEYMQSRSQDLPPAYHDCGQFYFINTEAFLDTKQLFTDHTIPYEMPESEVQDIDNEEDWKVAEIKYTFLLEKTRIKKDV
ncbi:pseudaminic acid cytidylyltransferase [Pedobacter heparinus]|uniref:Acylneuraminate cytidylyltransferase n=1 Tax=Pedobacter heparinus (strain ATCC 13125 / DSM 2366 / CIP 104194 / JCM 7457 / NBRC 12017 / NCIMB 9290 / NRRL B-14731 / HIM 762-3) TaxID=485917 RepID=C6XVQ7_PEDHD|nr:pseudaminic acid cytidylyltransferase [Pedobacter heparinus]ACU06132.1 acylneuraminate cytidylyltransferase [Pedobacter heparinus DSM 2366]